MPRVSSEIIAEITNHIGKLGGDFNEWCVGTARDWHSPVLEESSATLVIQRCGSSIATRLGRRDKTLSPHEVPQD